MRECHRELNLKKVKLVFIVLAAYGISTISAAPQIYPPGDLNRDYKVGFEDLVIFSGQWLDDPGCAPPDCAELDGIDGVNMLDFALLLKNWHENYGLPLVINEFMASNNNTSGISDPQGHFDDWIEIYNYGEKPINMGGFYLSDDLENATVWKFPIDRPGDTTIAPNGFILVWADEDDTETDGLHADFQLRGNGEEIGLFAEDGTTLIDSITFTDQVSNISYGRYPNAYDDWRFFPVGTPAVDNNNAYIGFVADTKFSHNRGFHDSPFNLEITCFTPGAEIYYTTDGSAPIEGEAKTASGKLYSGPISINSNACIRAAAIKTGWMPTDIDTHTYVFNASGAIKAMPAVFLVGDEYKTFYGPDGIMSHFTRRGIEYERPVSFELVDLATGAEFQQDCGIRIHGSDHTRPQYTVGDDWSTCWIDWWPHMNTNKIGFNLWFRSIYDDNRLEYPLFPFIDVDRFRSLVLRQGKNDACTPFVKDEWVRRLFEEMGRAQVTGTFANLYLNGEYKSYYNPTARGDEEFYQEWYGTENEFDVITQSGVRDGDSIAWNNLLAYVDSHDLSNMADYEYVAGKFDIGTFIDFLIVEIHVGNFDWPNNNWDVHRERSQDGIFRFSIWDAEGVEQWYFGGNCENCADTAFEDFPSYDAQGLNNGPWPICRLYRGLKANPEFRRLFADHIHRHYRNGGVLTESHLLQRYDDVFAEVSDVLPYTGSGVVTFIPDVFIPARQPHVLTAFHNNNLFDLAIGYPIFNVNGSYKYGGKISTGDTITITKSHGEGQIYYTTDGNDPRTPALTVPDGGFLLPENADKKVFVPSDYIGTNWRGGSEPYDDSNWTSGSGGVGYERSSGYENYIGIDVNASMSDRTSCYVRIPFTLDGDQLETYTGLELKMRYDDGFVAYINGAEVYRMYFTGSPQWDSRSSGSHEASAGWNSYDISDHMGTLQAGSNILAIHGMNTSSGSSDFLISAQLKATVDSIDAGISPSAILYTGSFNLSHSTNLKSRILTGTGKWGVLNEAVYNIGEVADNLRITEIMYHPAGDPNSEFIEIKNIHSTDSINPALVKFTNGIDFEFPPDFTLAAGEYAVVVRNSEAFNARYPSWSGKIAGQYHGALDNDGDTIELVDALGNHIHDFKYKDGWYSLTDGGGFSLTIWDDTIEPVEWNKKISWLASSVINGTPGESDIDRLPPEAIVINEVLAHSHTAAPDWIELKNTTGSNIEIGGWFLSDSDSDDANIKKYEFPADTVILAGGYLVLAQDVTFGNPSADGCNIPFGLSEGGETVYIHSGENGTVTGYYLTQQKFDASETNISLGRYEKEELSGGYDFAPMASPTKNNNNSQPLIPAVVITEIYYDPDRGVDYEFVELYNRTGSDVRLMTEVTTETSPGVIITEEIPWRLEGTGYVFQPDTVIGAGEYILVAKNPTKYTSGAYDVYGPYTGKLQNGGEQIEIQIPGDQEYDKLRYWIPLEKIDYDNELPWPDTNGNDYSIHRKNTEIYGRDHSNWQAKLPSPGE